jgi:hypothetical protein
MTGKYLAARLGDAWVRFVAAPASPRPLACLRIGLAAVLLAQGAALLGNLNELFGSDGLIRWSVSDATLAPGVPRLAWAAQAAQALGADEASVVRLLFATYLGAVACLLVGWRSRVSALIAWFVHLLFMAGGNLSIYGVDQFANVFLFYCVWMPVGACWSLDATPDSSAPSCAARLSLRVIQIHLCVVYFTSGLEKASGSQWYDGEAIWRSMMRTDLGQFDCGWLAWLPWLAQALSVGTLVVEVGYAAFVWPRRTRRLWALATISLHLGIAIALGLVSFAAVMIVLNLSAFVIDPEPATPVENCR